MEKYYRVKKDTFLWKEGAILCTTVDGTGYRAVKDIWDKVPLKTEYITAHIIENPDNADTFERVYPDTVTGNLFRTKDQMLKMYKDAFKA